MKVLMCVNGHYFDTDKYVQCPHCGAPIGNGEKPNTMSVNLSGSPVYSEEPQQKKSKGLFGKKKEDKGVTNSYYNEANFVTGSNNISMQITPIQPVVPNVNVMQRPDPSQAVMSNMNVPGGNNPTISIWEQDNAQVTSDVASMNSMNNNEPISVSIQPVQQVQPVVQQQTSTPSVQSINAGQMTGVNKTDDVRTVAIYGSDIEPVTGWLVCVKGECYGESFNISAGRNNIGRGTNMDIAIVGESTISREKQAIIIFEPNKQQFIMQPGESGSLTYVNDELLLNFVQLNPYDVIQMGNAKFIFIPLCGEKFNWNDYKDE